MRVVAKEISVNETNSVPPEEIVWRGTSSHWKNFGVYLLCGLFCWLILPLFFALVYYLKTKNKVFELTTQRLKITSGVFSKVTETLELYRVKDIETRYLLCPRSSEEALGRERRLGFTNSGDALLPAFVPA